MRRLPATAAALAAVATLGVGAGSAFAAGTPNSTTPAPAGSSTSTKTPKTPATLQEIQAKAASAISARVTALNAEIAKVQAAKDLGGDQATLLSQLQGDVTGEQQLGQKIAADTTVAAAKADTEGIFTNFRVFALALPVAHLVTASDRVNTTTIPKLSAQATKLATKVTAANSPQITPLLNDMNAKLAAAGSATKGFPAQLLSLTPAAYNANHSVLDAPKAAAKSAAGDLKAAVADRKQIVTDLKGDKGAGHAKTAPTTGAATPAPTTAG